MSSLFAILLLLAFALLIWGVAVPRSLGRVIRNKALTRARAAWIFGSATLLLFILTGVTAPAPPAQPVSLQKSSQTQNQVQADHIETKQVTETQPIPFTTTTQDDSSLPKGQTQTTQDGKDGVTTYTYSVTYTNGKETKRSLVSQQVTTPAVTKVIRSGTYVAPPKPAPAPSCTGGYINVDGNCIPSPGSNPSGATAVCGDGTYSYSQHRSGTCSHHGGVARWL